MVESSAKTKPAEAGFGKAPTLSIAIWYEGERFHLRFVLDRPEHNLNPLFDTFPSLHNAPAFLQQFPEQFALDLLSSLY